MEQKLCNFCGKIIVFKKYARGYANAKRQKYCDQFCSISAQFKDSPTRSAYLKRAKVFMKENCEKCGIDKKLTIHHKNKDWKDNAESNLMTLCKSCHTKHHFNAGDYQRPKKYCSVCENVSRKHGYCGKHFQRWKRTGSVYLIKNGLKIL